MLIADDEPTLRLLVTATLSSENYEILEASNGAEAVALVKAKHPRLALLDFHMPIMDGLEACRRIKADPELQGTSVVMLTSASDPQDVDAGFQAGADRYLTKPFSPIELLQVIEEFMG